MAKVTLPRPLAQRFGAEPTLEVEASSIRDLMRALEARMPGIGEEIEASLSVAIDGEIFPDPFLEPIAPESEVHFIARIAGGES